METKNNRVRLAIIQTIIAFGIGIAVFVDTRHAIIYGVVGLALLAIAHWTLRDKVKQDIRFLLFVILAFAIHFILKYIGSKNSITNPESTSTLEILSYAPLVIVFIGILFLVVKHYRSSRASKE